ncbi:rho GTPase-activating protein 7 isoform X4 [Tachysurus ichikawai]
MAAGNVGWPFGARLINRIIAPSRHTPRRRLVITEIEAKEACTWLRAAGFPQYAQLYEGKNAGFFVD